MSYETLIALKARALLLDQVTLTPRSSSGPGVF